MSKESIDDSWCIIDSNLKETDESTVEVNGAALQEKAFKSRGIEKSKNIKEFLSETSNQRNDLLLRIKQSNEMKVKQIFTAEKNGYVTEKEKNTENILKSSTSQTNQLISQVKSSNQKFIQTVLYK
jgi:hypothetical protein